MEDVSIEEEKIPDTSQSDVAAPEEADGSAKKCCGWLEFHGCKEASGYGILGLARGAIVMSNLFLASSFIYLASDEAGCLNEKDQVIEGCENTVHGFQPPSLVANIAVISGLLSAFLMPLTGAIIDFTPHRRLVGILASALLTVIQAAQIFTISSTWFPMLILQAIAGFVYQVVVLSNYAYLPEIARSVGQKLMTRCEYHLSILNGFSSSSYVHIVLTHCSFFAVASTFTMMQFSAQALYLVLVFGIAIVFDFDNVNTAQLSQGINVLWISIGFFIGWKMLPDVPSRHELQEGHSIWTEGFTQIWHTSISINRNYPHGLRWFLLSTVFAEAGANAFTVISVIFLSDHLGMNSKEIGVVFLITLVAAIPGARIGSIVIEKTDPNTSWKIVMVFFSVVTFAGSFALAGPNQSYLAYVWGTMWGFLLG
jgi:MFS-type transporter involved in bile tolerance (Atg22 family)